MKESCFFSWGLLRRDLVWCRCAECCWKPTLTRTGNSSLQETGRLPALATDLSSCILNFARGLTLKNYMNHENRGHVAYPIQKYQYGIWVVVKSMVLFWVLSIIRHLVFRGPKKGTIILTTNHLSHEPLKGHLVLIRTAFNSERKGKIQPCLDKDEGSKFFSVQTIARRRDVYKPL